MTENVNDQLNDLAEHLNRTQQWSQVGTAPTFRGCTNDEPHHWVATHQSDFPPCIHWVSVCSQCGRVNGDELAAELAEKDVEVEQFLETVRAERDKAREECGHEKAMRAYLAEELSGWIKRATEARDAIARVEAVCDQLDLAIAETNFRVDRRIHIAASNLRAVLEGDS